VSASEYSVSKKVIDKFFKAMDSPDKPLIFSTEQENSVPVESMSLLFQLVPYQEPVQ
jgi:hypothetical protein